MVTCKWNNYFLIGALHLWPELNYNSKDSAIRDISTHQTCMLKYFNCQKKEMGSVSRKLFFFFKYGYRVLHWLLFSSVLSWDLPVWVLVSWAALRPFLRKTVWQLAILTPDFRAYREDCVADVNFLQCMRNEKLFYCELIQLALVTDRLIYMSSMIDSCFNRELPLFFLLSFLH